MKPINRRELIKSSIASAAAFSMLSRKKAVAANEKVIFGIMGLGGRGTQLAIHFSQRPDVEIAYLCDPDTRRFARARSEVEENQSRSPRMTQDFRHILDDKDVDVFVNATPDHWHGLGTVMACQAGKDVFVEKPMAHNIWEGRKMIEAARKYDRVVQVGMQSRSAAFAKKAKDYIQSGQLGDVYLVRVCNMMKHPFRKSGLDQPVPKGFDYELWCGPAPKLPFNPDRRWLDQWEFSCGGIAGDAIHQLDLARFLIDDKPFPQTVSNAGGVNVLKDGRQIPDTQLVTYEYGSLTLLLEAALWMPYMKKTPTGIRDSDKFPDWAFNSTKIEIFGTDGFMYVGRHGGGWQAYDAAGELTHSEYGRQGDREHQNNFLECIRTRERPNADVEVGHQSAVLSHLANISYRVGNKKLEFDPRNESFKNSPEANQFLKRTYREPWVMPEQV